MKKLGLLLVGLLVLSSLAFGQPENLSRGIKLEVKGLSIAIDRVHNNETRAHLEEVLAKITVKRQEQLSKLQNLETESDNEKVYVKGDGEGKLLGIITVKKQYKYEVTESGELVRVKRWNDAFVKDVGAENV